MRFFGLFLKFHMTKLYTTKTIMSIPCIGFFLQLSHNFLNHVPIFHEGSFKGLKGRRDEETKGLISLF